MCHGIEVSLVTICKWNLHFYSWKSFCLLEGKQWRPWWSLGLYCLPKYTIRSYRYKRVVGFTYRTKMEPSQTVQTNNKVVCATSKGSDLSAHTCSMIWDFAKSLILYECFRYWPNIIWSFTLKIWLHRLVAFFACKNATLMAILWHGSNELPLEAGST